VDRDIPDATVGAIEVNVKVAALAGSAHTNSAATITRDPQQALLLLKSLSMARSP
jgi:hypothetical protein